jgi:DNA-binding transcriptional MerR regulator
MRMAELSRESGVPTPTIKYYLREGLLLPGEKTGPNQARYDARHLRRLRLIRAMLEVGGISVATAKEVLATVDAAEKDTHRMLGAAQYLLTARRHHCDQETRERAEAEASRLLAERDWRVPVKSPARIMLAEVIGSLRTLGQDDFLDRLGDYAQAADDIAAVDLSVVARRDDLESMMEGVILGNLLGDTLIAVLRRLAQENRSERMFGT